MLAQRVEQRDARLDRELMLAPVDVEVNGGLVRHLRLLQYARCEVDGLILVLAGGEGKPQRENVHSNLLRGSACRSKLPPRSAVMTLQAQKT